MTMFSRRVCSRAGWLALGLLLCGFLLLEERLAPLQWLGAALALVSVLLINRRDRLWQPAVAGASDVASGPVQETEAR
jgi:hypothetical protein